MNRIKILMVLVFQVLFFAKMFPQYNKFILKKVYLCKFKI